MSTPITLAAIFSNESLVLIVVVLALLLYVTPYAFSAKYRKVAQQYPRWRWMLVYFVPLFAWFDWLRQRRTDSERPQE